METGAADASGGAHALALGPYATAVGWILLRLLLQIVAGLLATVAVMALCSLPAVTSSRGFKMMTAEAFGTDAMPMSSAIEYFQLVAECLFLVFVLVEFARALIRLARLARP
jgi:hypothetical protein